MSSDKETTPVPSAASDAPSAAAGPGNQSVVTFSDKELKNIIAAMQSLKDGPPDIDMDKFHVNGQFQSRKTAQNQWAVLKGKLKTENAVFVTPQKATPQKKEKAATTTPKKRTKKDADGEDGGEAEEGTPAKKLRTPKSKKKNTDSDEADAFPKKKTPAKKAPGKKAAAKIETKVKDEDIEDSEVAATASEEGETKQSIEGAEKEKTPATAGAEVDETKETDIKAE